VAKKPYCGNLDYAMTDEQLREMFAQYGEVRSAEVIMDRDTGRSKGFGFVEMANDDEAEAAIAALNEKQQSSGRPMRVNEARPREDRPRGGGGGYRGGGGGYGGGGGGGRGRGGYGGGEGGERRRGGGGQGRW